MVVTKVRSSFGWPTLMPPAVAIASPEASALGDGVSKEASFELPSPAISSNARSSVHRYEKLLSQVSEWLHTEKAKRERQEADGEDLDQLQRILQENMSTLSVDSLARSSPRIRPRRLSSGPYKRKISAKNHPAVGGSEYLEGDVAVPCCEEVLDNSAEIGSFKAQVLRLAHTLRLKGWRSVPLDRGVDVDVKRLSGALTNAVYVVSPPMVSDGESPALGQQPPKRPRKLLLRIYGPQVEHLIDRENELGVLRRLARKQIGPRMLGTFLNGRFEEYLVSETLTARDLRDPSTSVAIAKRMRELHDGIDLLPRERAEGPIVWRNWDKWLARCEQVVTFLDRRGTHICGVEWPVFKAMVDKYRKWLTSIGELVFAHNDVGLRAFATLLTGRLNTETSCGSGRPRARVLCSCRSIRTSSSS
jgi:choline kinase